MNDQEFLIWVHERLQEVHGENHHEDYMHKLRAVITSIDKDTKTPNDGRGGNNIQDLKRRLNMEAIKNG